MQDKLALQEDNDRMELLINQIEERGESLETDGLEFDILTLFIICSLVKRYQKWILELSNSKQR